MKIRLGFVSNSSTSSFCMYGARIDKREAMALLGIEAWEDIDKIIRAKKLRIGYFDFDGADSADVYIGDSWRDIRDDETGRQFKDRIAAGIKALFGKDFACDTYEETYAS